jgi:hypothetical protein
MHRIVHSLAACVVLLHILGGCCWHHAHAESTGCCEHSSHPAEANDLAEGDQDCTGQGSHHSKDGCHEAGCVFVAPELRGVVIVVRSVQGLSGPCPDVFAAASTISGRDPLGVPPSGSGPPLRLHLLNQVLLV